MKQLILFSLTFFTSSLSFAQINLEDSTVQVIGYWDKNETQTYAITNEKYRVSGSDTTKREFVTYEVDVTIKDSTANSYTIEWLYRHIDLDTDNPLIRKLAGISENMKILIKTDEMGALETVINWEEIRDEVKKSTAVLRNEFKHIPQIDAVVDKVDGMFSTREAIEALAIKDIRQFYTYHGGKYTLAEEINGQLPVPNNLGGDPFNSDVTIRLDEINAEDNNSVIWMWQTIDPEALTDATYAYLKQNAGETATFPARADFPEVQTEITTAARIHGSGWVMYSRETKEVTADGSLAFEERTIEIK
ncbi:hypothetical protein [Pontibacter mangrovi]|uniref:Uncharacterized protein n=1 Tax=Pontibacter mangrovi TaxID=2589816 RepID=A0A501W8Y9_9BACT|nr:hypothetical protein [Pontibacter mangrovi]TPE46413.1 hypothetical protein FJM65_03470 [Pontibacter mangrovi]